MATERKGAKQYGSYVLPLARIELVKIICEENLLIIQKKIWGIINYNVNCGS